MAITQTQAEENIKKVDELAVAGLAGTANSLAYRVHEIEKHLHSREHWFGRHSSVSAGVNEGENLSVIPFDSTSGADGVFGAWIPILGTSDTPFLATYAKFDLHRIIISDVDSGANKLPHIIQIVWDDTAAADGYTDLTYTAFITLPERDGKAAPVDIQCPRITAGLKVWARHAVIGAATQGMGFYFGLHEYAG